MGEWEEGSNGEEEEEVVDMEEVCVLIIPVQTTFNKTEILGTFCLYNLCLHIIPNIFCRYVHPLGAKP